MLSVSENTVAGCARGEKSSGVLGAAEEERRRGLCCGLAGTSAGQPPSLPTDFLMLAGVREHLSFPYVRERGRGKRA